jgi:tetratricopeptide (TPR) repeat protein
MRSATSPALLTLLCAMNLAMPAAAQTSVQAAIELYSAAAYEDAIAVLDGLPKADATPADRASVDHVRMLCMLALGRTAEAEQAIASLLEGQPTYRLNEADASPRVLRVFTEVRRRALPDVFRQRYREAKRLYDDKQFEQATTAFAVVGELADDPDLASSADPALADLIQLAQGFAALTRAAVEADERRAATTASAADTKAAGSPGSAGAVPRGTAASSADPAPSIFDARDANVVPPVIEQQGISRWFGAVPRPRPGTNLGSIEVVIDESGAVTAATIRASVSQFYDTVLLESARLWRYQPATRQGRAVKYRRVIAVVMGS